MPLLPDTTQLALPLSAPHREPTIADAGAVPQRRPESRHKLSAELTDAELLAALLGPASSPSCHSLTTKHDGFREIAALPPTELLEHGFTTGAVNRMSAVFEIAKRYGEKEFKIGEPLRGSGTSTLTSASGWRLNPWSISTRCCWTTSTESSAMSS